MEIKGDNFIKNVQIKQEQKEIKDRLNELENELPSQNRSTEPNFENELENMNQNSQQFDDIVLNDSNGNKTNKKKYIVLGLTLIILFLLTIIAIRLLTNDKSTDDSFTNSDDNSNSETVLNNDNIEEQYQKIINEKLKKIENENINDSMNIVKTEVDELQIVKEISKQEQDRIDSLKNDLESVKTEEPKITRIVKKEVVQKVTPKKVIKKAPVKKTAPKTTTLSNNKPTGTFVQIFALSKKPSSKLINNINSKGYEYILYDVTVKGKKYTKVLVGPYDNKNSAKFQLGKIKFDLDAPNAYILTF